MDLTIYKKRKPIKLKEITIPISGAKNSAVAIIPAALLTKEEVIINNVPDIDDVKSLITILSKIGHKVEFSQNTIRIKRKKKAKWVFPDEVEKLRGSYYFIGVYLGYFGKIALKSCGGCDLGKRTTNYHKDGFLKLGAKFQVRDNFETYKRKKIKGAKICLPTPSVGATINLLLASVISKGETIIHNYAKEIEVIDVCNFLISMGAKIKMEENSLIISGVKKLHGTNYTIVKDRIEAGTYLALGCLLDNHKVTVNINPIYLESFLSILENIGHIVEKGDDYISCSKGLILNPTSIETNPYPAFPTDLGPIITVLLTQIPGTSTLQENIFSNRFSHVQELIKMGANIEIINNTLTIKGKSLLKGTTIQAHDLRCSAALLLASTIATNSTTIKNIDTLERGYENYLQKLSLLSIKYD